jgi:putative hemolysin
MDSNDTHLIVRLAATDEDLRAVQRLRYEVFVEELGGGGTMVDHTNRLERDVFDPHAAHILLEDSRHPGRVVGTYRLMSQGAAAKAGHFYTEAEYDLTPLRQSGRRLLELGRSCLHHDYRGGTAMFRLWQGIADYVSRGGFDVLFGVASFHGQDPKAHAEALSLLHHRYLAPRGMRPKALEAAYHPMGLTPEAKIDRVGVMRDMPALIKAYLRLGGRVGEGAFVDRAFNTVDVCLVVDVAAMSPALKARYTGGAA